MIGAVDSSSIVADAAKLGTKRSAARGEAVAPVESLRYRPPTFSDALVHGGFLAYTIEYSPDTLDHLRALTARERAIVLDAVDVQLTHEPTVETRNRKPMRPNPVALWELRIGDLRVYYDVEEAPEPRVLIRALGVKERNRVRIGRKEYEL
jgi:mRNA-degrading endonuclease RelE of RelBE toxin-antitoxin system